MKFTPFIAAAILAYGAHADEEQKPLADESSSSVAEAATSSVNTALPTFTVSLEPSDATHPRHLNMLIAIIPAHYPQGTLPRAIHR